jgi:hypothetical protein
MPSNRPCSDVTRVCLTIVRLPCSAVARRAHVLPLREKEFQAICGRTLTASRLFTVRSRRANSGAGLPSRTVRWNVAPNARPPLPVSGRGVQTAESESRKRKAQRPHRLKPVPLKKAGEEVRKEARFYAGVLGAEETSSRLFEGFSAPCQRCVL